MSKRKYRTAYQFFTMAAFADYKGTYFIVRFGKNLKTVHRGFLESWQYRTLKRFVENGWVYASERIDDERT